MAATIKWWQQAVVYQVYPRSFQDTNHDGIGGLKGITAHLDYLKQLGIDVIWLNPIYRSPNDDNGYDISDYQQIAADFGTMADFDELLQAAHDRGLKLIMDLVVNHTSDEHPWFKRSRQDRTNQYRDFYFWRSGNGKKAPNNWDAAFGGSAWQYDEQTQQYYLHTFSTKQPDLNWENPTLRESVYTMMTWWLNKGVDGFRMDVINQISKLPGLPNGPLKPHSQFGDARVTNGPRVHEFLQEMNQEVLSQFDIMTVGETHGVTPADALKYAGADRHELDMVFEFQHLRLDNSQHGLGKWSTRKTPLVALKKVISDWQVGLEGRAWNSLFWNNHDTPRAVSRFGDDRPAYRVRSAKMLATCLHILQGTPYIYQGEELGMTDAHFTELTSYRDIESLNAYRDLVTERQLLSPADMMARLAARSRDNSRTPMQWDTEVNAGFSDAAPWLTVNPNYRQINAAAALADPDSVWYYYQHLIQLRHQYPLVTLGSFELLWADDPQVFLYARQWEGRTWLVCCNFTAETLSRPLDQYLTPTAKCLISNYGEQQPNKLRPYEAWVYQLA
ncbi:glycoside hydrolase family 13 protein [Lactiplantibacillus plantarum]|uniref:glycoside hydrolase family 13 protein n=1 Tax=Lactiplantibacillus plantarum TaxID=1590 RepID=UPI00048594BF|nr:alpha-glucosidase [Lactiplantibacillus plantarum]AQX92348.1 glucohydrolase [Lactiplantibacillus plantarum]AWL16034.1 alpha-glucosidase [Lactiplantibacillus plantarum]AYA80093.1 alpha-glucosidase [Lactiplantibacillus plantarum]AYC69432.1 alpha-glucosidase [Lactiplantibacillus plantarum]AYC75851.1 alpha-glucosidase [Lactiplantibacillus plantarum]